LVVGRSCLGVVECGQRFPFVVDVRAADDQADRNSRAVRQDVALGATLGSIGGVLPSVVPPLGAFTIALSRADHFRSIPFASS
jgi:hypothetical protein